MAQRPHIVVAGILDTKGNEIKFLAERVRAAGGEPIIMELTVGGEVGWADIPVSELAKREGKTVGDLSTLDRNKAAGIVMAGGLKLVTERLEQGSLDGIIGFGGSMGSSIVAHIMQGLPIGLPKLLLSTMTSGDVGPYVGTKDVAMMYPIAEVGLNRVTRKVLNNAAAAIVGMASAPPLATVADKPLIGCMMFGVTTPTVLHAAAYFEQRGGYDVMINHAVGSGGRSMEELITDGYIVGVLDITTHEIADELFGGVLGAGPDRLTAAGRKGIPQVVSVGGLDLLNFGPRDTLPKKYEEEEHLPGRCIYVHNPTVTCAGVSLQETEQLGSELGTKLKAAKGPTVLCIPLRGWGAVDIAAPNKEFGWAGPGAGPAWCPDPDQPEWSLRNRYLIRGLSATFDFDKANLDVLAVDRHMNDPAFADLMAGLLEEMLDGRWSKGSHHNLPEVVEVTREGLAQHRAHA
jgi:uncharacterized protein (UPF0261 family)